MSDVLIYHPVTRALIEVPEEAVFHYRPGGWLLKSEWDDNQAQAAQQAKSAKKSTEEK